MVDGPVAPGVICTVMTRSRFLRVGCLRVRRFPPALTSSFNLDQPLNLLRTSAPTAHSISCRNPPRSGLNSTPISTTFPRRNQSLVLTRDLPQRTTRLAHSVFHSSGPIPPASQTNPDRDHSCRELPLLHLSLLPRRLSIYGPHPLRPRSTKPTTYLPGEAMSSQLGTAQNSPPQMRRR